jgi:DNA-binding CsgD family transcriptional regulator
VFAEIDHHALIAFSLLSELHDVALTYYAGDPAYRRALASGAEVALHQAGGAMQAGLPSAIGLLATMVVDGDWFGASALLDSLPEVHHAYLRREVSTAQAYLGMHQGTPDRAWDAILRRLPLGPNTAPGDIIHQEGLELQRLAIQLAIAQGDASCASRWLQAQDRWLEWGQGSLGLAGRQVVTARYLALLGQPDEAREAARAALALAVDPEQPLVLLRAHRLAGELDLESGNLMDADWHLAAALDLATACDFPFERCQISVALGSLAILQGRSQEAESSLEGAAAIATQLGASPTLARIDELSGRLTASRPPPARPMGMTPRELDVLRLLGAHLTNREIAERLFVSPRTVQTHVEHICAKLGVENRRQAASRAVELGLL